MQTDKLYRFKFDQKKTMLVIAPRLKDAMRMLHENGEHEEPSAYQRMQGRVIAGKCAK